VFKEFVGLPNLYINTHLALHVQTYGNLINTGNIKLDLLKHYTTLFAIRHLIDGGIDIRSSSPSQVFQENEELNDDEG
ncbi:9182_t:CDS:2, partial [Scutellospora calospora]